VSFPALCAGDWCLSVWHDAEQLDGTVKVVDQLLEIGPADCSSDVALESAVGTDPVALDVLCPLLDLVDMKLALAVVCGFTIDQRVLRRIYLAPACEQQLRDVVAEGFARRLFSRRSRVHG
jgi:hypothetical protein